nr:carbon starvation protein A [Alistipes sp.]
LKRRGSRYGIIAFLPAIVMTYVCSSFVFVSNQFLGMGSVPLAYAYGAVVTIVVAVMALLKIKKDVKNGAEI